MAELKVDGLGEKKKVKVGSTVSFEVTVTGGTEPYKYKWKKDGAEIQGAANEKAYKINEVKDTDAGAYGVDVEDAGGNTGISAATLLQVDGAGAEEEAGEERVLLWRPWVVGISFALAAVAFAALLWVIWWPIDRLWPDNTQDETFAGAIAVQLTIVGVLAVAVGFYLAFLELSGRSRTIKELKDEKDALAEPTIGTFGPVTELAKVAPELVTRFGSLKAPAGAMIVGVALFICATALAWKAIPDSGADEPTVSTDTGTTPAPTTPEPTTPAPTEPGG